MNMNTKIPNQGIYIVDDEKSLLDSLFITLKTEGFNDIEVFNNGQEIIDALPQLRCRVLLLDLFMPRIHGEQILEQVSFQCPEVQVIVITGINETETAVRCMKNGAFDYLVKPIDTQRLITTVRRALHHYTLVNQNLLLKSKLLTGDLENPDHFSEIITADSKMKSLFNYMEVIAPSPDPVLITGETGTGKDLAAKSIHKASKCNGPFISLNSAGLDDNVFADTLFGHVMGAFTDARETRKGLVEQAGEGTLFLDEIGDLTQPSQLKLLSLIQNKTYYPLGSDISKKSKARIVAATNRDLTQSIKKGQFRRDLFYRINTYHVHLPPLRQRLDDIPLLAEHFHHGACADLKIDEEKMSSSLIEVLRQYDYPGNVRELRSLIYGSLARGGLEVLEKELCRLLGIKFPKKTAQKTSGQLKNRGFSDPLPTLEQASEMLISLALNKSDGNQSNAAKILGISRQALNQRLKKLNAK
ncbi:MAG: sigma-54-dependent transcriptional regulator [Desulfonatronovibrio sp.]